MTNFFESELFKAVQEECQKTYDIYRYTKAYVKFMYDHSGITWKDTFEITGGKEFWMHHNKFTEKFWNQFPEQYPPFNLKYWMMQLINVSIEDLQKTVAMDVKEYIIHLPQQQIPNHYLEYVKFFPIAHKLPSGSLSMDEAMEFIIDIPFDENVRARWVETDMCSIHFQRDRKYYFTFFKPSMTMKDDAVLFEGYNRHQHYFQIGNKNVSLILS